MTHYLGRAALLVILSMLGLMTVLFALQTRLIFPGASTQGTDSAKFEPPEGTELLRLTTRSGETVTALFAPALAKDGRPLPHAERRPTLLYVYGNGTILHHVVRFELDRLRRLGVNVMVPEYVGYGLSTGAPSESGCYETIDAAYDHLRTRTDVDPKRIVAFGRSLGGAVAIDLASRRDVAGLIVFSSFTRMSDMAKRQFPMLPLSMLLKHKFDSLSKIDRVTCPILIGHGRIDGIVPAEMAARLAAAAKAPVTSFVVEDANHNDLEVVGGDQVFKALRKFLARVDALP